MTLLKYLSCVVIGAVCAWLVLNKTDDHYVPVGCVLEPDAADQRAQEQLETLQRNVESMTQHSQALYTELRTLKAAYTADREALAVLHRDYEQARELAAQAKQVLSEEVVRLTAQLKAATADRDQFKVALKQQRADYIQLANKNAALERASIEELAKRHKADTQVSKRDLSPVMQAIVSVAGVPGRVPLVVAP